MSTYSWYSGYKKGEKMKTKVFVSLPMNGRAEDEIKQSFETIKNTFPSDWELLDTLFDFGDKSPIYYLGKSIELMSEANIVIFAEDWENARGCRIEYEVAKQYGKTIMIMGKNL